MKHTKKLAGILLALVMVMSMATTAFAAETTTLSVAEGDTRTYEVYQIFTGDLSGSTLSNVKWGANGKNGNTAVEAGDAVPQAVLDALTAVNSENEIERLKEIEKYVNLSSAPVGTISAGAPLTVTTGYYLLKDVTADLPDTAERSTFVVEIVGPTTITPKADDVTSEKKVKDANDTAGSTTGWQDSADYDQGDHVPFQLKATLTSKYDYYDSYKLTFHDTLSDGLTFDGDSVKVYIDGAEITSGYEVVTTGLTDGCTFEVRFADLKTTDAEAGDVITVEYTATLNENAVIGGSGNPNTMHVEYSNDPNWDGTETEPTGNTPDDKVVVFTYKVIVDKVDANNEPLAGAGFTLYKKVGSEWIAVGDELTGDDMTQFTWERLDDGDYKLEETTTPDGYNTIDPIEFTISAEHDAEGAAPTLTSLSASGFTADLTAGSLTTDVVNQAGTVLPETGGIGTTIFYALGGILMVGAAVLLITKKRMNAE